MNGMIYFTNQTNMFQENNGESANTGPGLMKYSTPSKNHRIASDDPSRSNLLNNLLVERGEAMSRNSNEQHSVLMSSYC